MLAKEYLYKFIQQTESLYSGLSNYVGKEKDDKIILVNSRAISDYLKKSQNDYSPKFTSNDAQYYINRIIFLIFQDKRDMINSDKKIKDKIDSPEDFSAKCVDLFFRLSGINFIFLRLYPNNATPSFIASRQLQQTCLINLFKVTINYLIHRIQKESIKKNSKQNDERNAEDICSLLASLWGLLFKLYRFILCFQNTKLFQDGKEIFFTNKELYDYLKLLNNDYQGLKQEYRQLKKGIINSGKIQFYVDNSPTPPKYIYKLYYKEQAKKFIVIYKLIKKISEANNNNIQKIIKKSILSDNVKYTNYKLGSKDSSKKFEIINEIINDYYSTYDSFRRFLFYWCDVYNNAVSEYTPIYFYFFTLFNDATENVEHLDDFFYNGINQLINDIDRDFWYFKLRSTEWSWN